jgi:hypothetical protein
MLPVNNTIAAAAAGYSGLCTVHIGVGLSCCVQISLRIHNANQLLLYDLCSSYVRQVEIAYRAAAALLLAVQYAANDAVAVLPWVRCCAPQCAACCCCCIALHMLHSSVAVAAAVAMPPPLLLRCCSSCWSNPTRGSSQAGSEEQ